MQGLIMEIFTHVSRVVRVVPVNELSKSILDDNCQDFGLETTNNYVKNKCQVSGIETTHGHWKKNWSVLELQETT